ncbi:MAG: acyltransferase family protein [Polyangiaceae bacterium]|nr:acyltransferase family protein [Polyangiaceae bacterium]
MDRARTALVRLTDAAVTDVLPWVGKLSWLTRRSLDELGRHTLGEDFEERSRELVARYAAAGGDPFGLDPEVAKYAVMVCAFFHRVYFRTQISGLSNVPDGRVLLIANHSGQVPIDGAIIGSAMFLDARPPRMIRAMVEKWSQTLPFVSTFFQRVGQVVGVQENARRLLEMDEALLVFPEGTRGISKPFQHRYQLQEFGHGFMRLAMETRTPIVPVAVIGAEEQYVNVGNVRWLAKALGMPVFPVIPQMFIPGGQLPLPTKYHLYFGEPMSFEGDADEDDGLTEERVWLVRQTIQSMINRGLRERRGLFR